jgi:hypothetical protein
MEESISLETFLMVLAYASAGVGALLLASFGVSVTAWFVLAYIGYEPHDVDDGPTNDSL